MIAPINWLRLAFLGVIWGAAFMATKLALGGIGPFTLVALRLSIGALFLLTLLRITGSNLPSLGTSTGRIIWGFAIAMGLLSNVVPFSLLSWGQQHVASGFAGVTMATVPLMILPLAYLFVPGEGIGWRRVVGFGIGTLGVIVLIGPAALRATNADFESLARLACLGAAMCYAMGSILTRLCPQVDLLALSAAALIAGTTFAVPLALTFEGVPQLPPSKPLLAILYLGILPTGVAQLVLVQVIRTAGPVFMGLVNYMVPLWSVVFGVLLLSEPLPSGMLWAMFLILGGVALSQSGALLALFRKR